MAPQAEGKKGKKEKEKEKEEEEKEKEEEEAEEPEEEYEYDEDYDPVAEQKRVFRRRLKKYVTINVVLMLGIGALGALYHFELKKIGDEMEAMNSIRKFMVSRSPMYSDMNDTNVLFGAKTMAEMVEDIHAATLVAEDAIADAIKKLSQGWKAHKGYLYYLSHSQDKFDEARRSCEALKTSLASVPSADVEEFVEPIAKLTRKGVWIGLQLSFDKWEWIDRTEFNQSFWRDGAPGTIGPIQKECAEVMKDCPTPGRCWNDISCDERRSALCKMIPSPDLAP